MHIILFLWTTRTAKQKYSVLEVADMLMENDIDLDDPIMEGSDDEFSDIEWNGDDSTSVVCQ